MKIQTHTNKGKEQILNEFDEKAAGWDKNPMHWDRSVAIVNELTGRIPLTREMTALEYGAGTGITSFLIKDHLREVFMMDNSTEMVRVMEEKIVASKAQNLKAVFFDLEKEDWKGIKFDLLISQMVLHHVYDLDNIFTRFSNIIKPGGFLAIADLYPEEGLFHGEDFYGHHGFDPAILSETIRGYGFSDFKHGRCFVINKMIDERARQFDVFLLTANRI